jgi:pyruvate dehydrogenase E2 component (dihydrolipoamide acetyltransferase)
MATKVYMEALSPTMEEGRLITWLKNEGDQVNEGDVLAEVETDKATMELVARGSGVLRKRMLGEGETANVGTVIAVVAAPDEDIASIVGTEAETPSAPPAAAAAEKVEEAGGKKDAAVAQAETELAVTGEPSTTAPAPATAAAPAAGEGGRVKASPLARRLAEEQGVELGAVQGSGPGGRIVKRDVEAAAQAPAPAAAQAPEGAPAPAPAAAAAFTEVPLTQMRKTIARRLTQSIGPVPTFYLTIEVDMTESMAIRKKINERLASEGTKVSPNDLVIKAVAMALTRHPWVNAAWTGESIRLYNEVHIGVAVAVEDGLITPVVRDADRKGIAEISREVKELAGRGREKKLKPEEYTGSTFSVSNLGMFGIEEFTAVINPPEAGILAIGTVTDKVVAENGQPVVRPRMRVTLSCDHRVIDGATGAQFLQTLKSYLEDPLMMIA